MIRRATKKHRPSVLPSVNLLSPWAFARMATRKLRRGFVVAGLALVLLFAAGWTLQHVRVEQAQQILSVEQAETSRLVAETQALAPVRVFATGVEQQKLTVQEAMADEIYFSRVVEGLQNAAPPGARLESVSITPAPSTAAGVPEPGATTDDGATAGPTDETASQASPSTSPCPGPDPFNTRVVVGCITVSGSANSRADVGEFVVRLGEDTLFVEPFISTTTTADAKRVTFSGSVGLSRKVYSHRYTDLEKLLEEGGRP